jgi:hypothetical protein
MFSAYRQAEFDRARAVLQAQYSVQSRETLLPQYIVGNCFQTLKLFVNLALAPAPLRTSHRSSWSVVTFCGDWIAGDLDIRSSRGLPITRPPDAGDMLIVRDGIFVGGSRSLEKSTSWSCFCRIFRELLFVGCFIGGRGIDGLSLYESHSSIMSRSRNGHLALLPRRKQVEVEIGC